MTRVGCDWQHRAIRFIVLVLLLSGVSVASAGGAAYAQTTGSIAGIVRHAGVGLEGVCVYADATGSSEYGSAVTASDGTYTVTGLTAGDYDVLFMIGCGSSGNYDTQWYQNVTNVFLATPVSVTAGSTTSGINDDLAVAGAISGTVQSDGTDLAGICVSAQATGSSGGSGFATTGSDGTYSLTGLPADDYDVEFSTGCGNSGNYDTQWYQNVTNVFLATPVSVTAGSTTSGINDDLAVAGAISGTVQSDGTDLAGICVSAQATGSSGGSGFATTGSDGTYSITGLPADDYEVEFSTGCGNSGNYETQWYDNVSSESSATPVSVTAGSTTSGINDDLAVAGAISGTVQSDGTDLAGICVSAQATGSSGGSGFATTGSDGTYSITGLPADDYEVEFSTGCGNSGNYETQWYDNVSSESSATPVSVTAGSTTSGIDDDLAVGGKIKGTVQSDGTDLAGICVSAQATGSSGGSGFATTRSDGTYSITGLPTDDYEVEFSTGCGNSGNYETQWYDNVSSESSATSVSVTAGSTTSGIDDDLAVGGKIKGTVQSDGTDLAGICVSAQATGSSGGSGFATTRSDGTYTIKGLPTDDYEVEFSTGCGNSGNYETQWYDNVSSESSATSVSVTAGSTTSGIDDDLAV